MKRMILSVLILLVFTVSCADNPKGSPVLVVENISWARNPSNNGAINVHCTVKNIGTADNTFLCSHLWLATLRYKVVFTNGYIMTNDCYLGVPLYMRGWHPVPNINESLSLSNSFCIYCDPETAVYTNSYYINANFIEKIEFPKPSVDLISTVNLP